MYASYTKSAWNHRDIKEALINLITGTISTIKTAFYFLQKRSTLFPSKCTDLPQQDTTPQNINLPPIMPNQESLLALYNYWENKTTRREYKVTIENTFLDWGEGGIKLNNSSDHFPTSKIQYQL